MLRHMRTTVILPDELYRQAKEAARSADRTFTSFLEDAVRRELARREASTEIPAFRVQPFLAPPGKGGPLPGVDLTNKEQIQEILDEDDFTVQRIRESQRARR